MQLKHAVIAVGLALVTKSPMTQANDIILIKNANIFDGKQAKLITGKQVLIENGKITQVQANIAENTTMQIIDAGGRTLTPGFIDAHYHLALCSISYADVVGMTAPDLDYSGILAAREIENVLQRGFTSVRDLGGAAWGAKLAADRQLVNGARVWPSLRTISQTGGHGDFSPRFAEPREFGGGENWAERIHLSYVVNGVPEVLAAVRDNLRSGASQIKIHAGGGVGSVLDPIDGLQFTEAELKAIVEVASKYDTYVAAHVYTAEGIEAAIKAGVKSIEHGNLVDERVIKMMADNDVWLSPQSFIFSNIPTSLGPDRLAKGKMVKEGLDAMFKLAKKHKVKMVFGTDLVLSESTCVKQNQEFVVRTQWFTPYEILKQATSLAGELLQLSGRRSPYPGKIGVIEPDAHADILLIDGNPLEDISILTDYEQNIDLIMKAGKVVKNTL